MPGGERVLKHGCHEGEGIIWLRCSSARVDCQIFMVRRSGQRQLGGKKPKRKKKLTETGVARGSRIDRGKQSAAAIFSVSFHFSSAPNRIFKYPRNDLLVT